MKKRNMNSHHKKTENIEKEYVYHNHDRIEENAYE